MGVSVGLGAKYAYLWCKRERVRASFELQTNGFLCVLGQAIDVAVVRNERNLELVGGLIFESEVCCGVRR